MPRYEIDLKQRSGKWKIRLEHNTLEGILSEWARYTAEMQTRPLEGQRKLRCTMIENGTRTVLARFAPGQPPALDDHFAQTLREARGKVDPHLKLGF
jgi:hypothetical protein